MKPAQDIQFIPCQSPFFAPFNRLSNYSIDIVQMARFEEDTPGLDGNTINAG
jgi:hypothetical protein